MTLDTQFQERKRGCKVVDECDRFWNIIKSSLKKSSFCMGLRLGQRPKESVDRRN